MPLEALQKVGSNGHFFTMFMVNPACDRLTEHHYEVFLIRPFAKITMF